MSHMKFGNQAQKSAVVVNILEPQVHIAYLHNNFTFNLESILQLHLKITFNCKSSLKRPGESMLRKGSLTGLVLTSSKRGMADSIDFDKVLSRISKRERKQILALWNRMVITHSKLLAIPDRY